MSEHCNAARLFVEAPLEAGARVALTPEQANYAGNALRLGTGDTLLAFNGRDGLWRCEVGRQGKRAIILTARTLVRPQEDGPDLHYLFAPLKRSRLDYLVQKAVEMGVARLVPVMTRHTVAERVNLARMRANAIEAAEQCGILRIPGIAEPTPLAAALAGLDADRALVFADEEAPPIDPHSALTSLRRRPLAVLIGPEGGFSREERTALLARPGTVRLSLGPRILRADTAAVAALALVNALSADWYQAPAVKGL